MRMRSRILIRWTSRVHLSLTVPMDRAFNGQIILDEDFQLISLINFDQWPGLLVIDKVYLARDAV